MTEPEKTPSKKEREDDSGGNSHRFALIIALVLIGIVAVAGWASFLFFWHNGNEKAEAFSGLLGFLAAILSSIVTVIFIYFTSASLQKAQASINLQREELEQIKSSVDLQRREWEQKVRVSPQFWITTAGTRQWFTEDPQYPGSNRRVTLRAQGEFTLHIWNHSEQSFLVNGFELERVDYCGVAQEHSQYLQAVVTPHSVQEVNVSLPIMRLLTRTPAANAIGGTLNNEPDGNARIGVALIFSDWSQSQVKSETQEFQFTLAASWQTVEINRSTKQNTRHL